MKPIACTADVSGVYQMPVARAAALLRDAALAAGLSWAEIDLRAVRGKRELLETFARALRFPGTFGNNWDATADCLQDLSWLDGRGWVLHIQNVQAIEKADAASVAVLMEILEAAAEYWRQQGRPFIVLVDAVGGRPVFPSRLPS